MKDSELLQYAKEFRAAIIGEASSSRWCAAISAPLCAALNAIGVKAGLLETDLGECNHVFLVLEDGRVLDPTADQFNWISKNELPGVYLGAQSIIHDGGRQYDFELWTSFISSIKPLLPDLNAKELGAMMRKVFDSMPNDLIQRFVS